MQENLEDKINSYLLEEYNFFTQKFGSSRILGTFLIGIGNYGFIESEKELLFVTVYLPTFDELCTADFSNDNQLSTHGKTYDIRKAYHAESLEDRSLEMLFSNHYLLNPRYEDLFRKSLLNYRELIAKLDPEERLNKALIRAKAALQVDDRFEAARLSIAASMYYNGKDCNECFHIKDTAHIQYLWACKNKQLELDAEQLLEDMQYYCNNTENKRNFKASSTVKEGIVKIMGEALNDRVTIDAFITCLTPTEKKAWGFLENLFVDGAAVISISKIIEETNISRPVWKSLLEKLEKNRMGFVQNHGVSGTTIYLNRRENHV